MKNNHTIYSVTPTGTTGGRQYLRLVQNILEKNHNLHLIPDFKRVFNTRRWRKIKHLFRIIWRLPFFKKNCVFLWDDISIILFTKKMITNTIFIFHHYDPKQSDSAPIEHYLYNMMFKKIKHCKQIICVSPHWQKFLKEKGLQSKIIYNSFDTLTINKIKKTDSRITKEKYKIPNNKINVYLGKGSHWKGSDEIYDKLKNIQKLNLIITGDNTLKIPINFYNPKSYEEYLKIIKACDLAIFNSTLLEGWSRVAAETILLEVPCYIKPIAGLGDLAKLTNQPPIPEELSIEDILNRINTSKKTINESTKKLSKFNLSYFEKEWLKILNNI